jgi:hypothetical protein
MRASALNRLGENRARIRELLAEIAAREAIGFGLGPAAVTWGHVGDTTRLIEVLQEAARISRGGSAQADDEGKHGGPNYPGGHGIVF